MTYIYDTTYLNVRRFHFILIVIKMYEGEVEVFDSLTKEPILYKSCFLMLKR
jgi:hypothetical protein